MNAKHTANLKRSLTTLSVVLGLAIATCATAQTTYNNTASGNWSALASWTGSQPSAGGASDAIINLAGTGLLATNDFSGAFTLNKLALTIGSGSLYSQSGSSLSFAQFGGNLPVITNVVGAALYLYSPVTLADDLVVGANSGSLTVMNGGSISSPTATLNIANGSFTNSGSITVKTLLATNNTATATNSIFAFGGGGSLTTSNLNGLAASIVLPPSYTNGARYSVNGVWNMNAGTNLVAYSTNLPYLAVSANSTINVNANAYLSLPGSTATNMVLVVGDASSGGKLVVDGGTVAGIRSVNLGNNNTNAFNSIVITNGGRIVASGLGVASWVIGNTPGAISNSFALYGANSLVDTAYGSLIFVNTGIGNSKMTVDAGVMTNLNALYCANTSGTNNTITVTNGGQVYCTNTLNIGLGAGCNDNSIYVYANSKIENLTTIPGTTINMAQGGNSHGNSLNIVGGTVTNFSTILMGASGRTNMYGNGIYVSSGGQLSGTVGATLSFGYNGNSNTISLVDAGTVGAFSSSSTLHLGRCLGGSTNTVGNSLIVSNGAQFSIGTLNIGYANNPGTGVSNNYVQVGGGTGNSILSAPGSGGISIGAMPSVTNSYLSLLTGGIISNTSPLTIGVVGSGGSRFNINGGTIVAKAPGMSIVANADGKVYIQSGGVTVDTSLGGLTLRSPCVGDPSSPGGGLTKFGINTMTLTNANTYTGQTTIGSGTLALGGNFATISGTTNISIADGATFSLAYSVPTQGAIDYTLTSGQTLSCSTNAGKANVVTTNTLAAVQKMLTLAPGAKLAFKADGLAVTNGEILVNGDLTLNANAISVNVENAALPVGNYRLLSCVGSGTLANTGTFVAPAITGLGASGTASLNVVTGPNGYVELQIATASGPTTGTNIQFSVSGGKTLNLTWPGSYLGWFMQSNSVSLISASDWHDILGSDNVTNLAIPMDTSKTNVFFRMRKP
ncbi:MAG: autotransporter-associated beta strand repeat-containing protein [Verrucomicrobiota bacterium]